MQKDCAALAEELEYGHTPAFQYNDSLKTAGLNYAKAAAVTIDQKSNNKKLAQRAIEASGARSNDHDSDTSLKRIKLGNTQDNGGFVANIQKRGEMEGASRNSQSTQKTAGETRGMIPNKKGTENVQNKGVGKRITE